MSKTPTNHFTITTSAKGPHAAARNIQPRQSHSLQTPHQQARKPPLPPQAPTQGLRASCLVASVLCAFLYAFSFTFGYSYVKGEGNLAHDALFLALVCGALTALLTLTFVFLPQAIKRTRKKYPQHSNTSATHDVRALTMLPRLNAKSLSVWTLILLAFWLIWFLILFPGVIGWDTYYQIWMTYPENHPMASDFNWTHEYLSNALSDHHPIFDTFIFALFTRGSEALTGNWNAGIALFCTIQMALTALALNVSFAWTNEHLAHKGLLCTSFIFVALFPVIPSLAATMLKDTFFSYWFLFFFVSFAEFAHSKTNTKPAWCALLVVSALLCCLTKKTGLYVVVPSLIILGIYLKTNKQKMITALASAVAGALLMLAFIPYVIFPVFDVAAGGAQEALSLPFLQTARYVMEYPDDISDEEYAAIDQVLNRETIPELYDADSADPIKERYNKNASTQDLLNYLCAYIRMGFRHPDSYMQAFLGNTAKFWAPGFSLEVRTITADAAHGGSELTWQVSAFDTLRDTANSLVSATQEAPLLGILFLPALYVFYIPAAFFLWCVYKRKLWYFVLWAPLGLTILSCLACPVFNARYCYPLILVTPFIILLTTLKSDAVHKQ